LGVCEVKTMTAHRRSGRAPGRVICETLREVPRAAHSSGRKGSLRSGSVLSAPEPSARSSDRRTDGEWAQRIGAGNISRPARRARHANGGIYRKSSLQVTVIEPTRRRGAAFWQAPTAIVP
jgi:hypothetical protein